MSDEIQRNLRAIRNSPSYKRGVDIVDNHVKTWPSGSVIVARRSSAS